MIMMIQIGQQQHDYTFWLALGVNMICKLKIGINSPRTEYAFLNRREMHLRGIDFQSNIKVG